MAALLTLLRTCISIQKPYLLASAPRKSQNFEEEKKVKTDVGENMSF